MELKTDLSSVFHIWSRLEQASNNRDPMYGDMTEIYVQHLLPEDLDYQLKDLWKQAGKALYSILTEFCNLHNARAFVDGKEIGEWMNDYSFFHKCDVRIAKKEEPCETQSSPTESK
jgi:hypothetical protein